MMLPKLITRYAVPMVIEDSQNRAPASHADVVLVAALLANERR